LRRVALTYFKLTIKHLLLVKLHLYISHIRTLYPILKTCCGTHVGVWVLGLDFGQRGVTVRAVVLAEVKGGLRVGCDQQLLDLTLERSKEKEAMSVWCLEPGVKIRPTGIVRHLI